MIFSLKIDTENDAFQPNPVPELVERLRQIADKIESDREAPTHFRTIWDSNGNDVGRYALKRAV